MLATTIPFSLFALLILLIGISIILIAKPFNKEKRFSVIVDYDLPLADMIAAGKYGWVNNEITSEQFPVKGRGKVKDEFIIKHFNRKVSAEDALKKLDEQGLRPVTIEELLAFGAKYPDEQRKYPIAALGSVGVGSLGDRVVAYLSEGGSGRWLNLVCVDFVWNGTYRLLTAPIREFG